ncbi:MAG: hypothetical protein II793_00600, partial [Bacteroidales bacterium]|nr:hypothetical protein [Bacteroidales bacterium]
MRRKLSFLFLLAALLLSGMAFAQAPQSVSYQAVVRHANNRLAVNQQVAIKLSILQGSADGAVVYDELHQTTTNANGLLSVILGQGIPSNLGGEFSDINWANGPYFIKSQVDVDGSGDFSLTSTQQMLSVPYAMHANSASSLIGLTDSLNTVRQTINDVITLGINNTQAQIADLLVKLKADSTALANADANLVAGLLQVNNNKLDKADTADLARKADMGLYLSDIRAKMKADSTDFANVDANLLSGLLQLAGDVGTMLSSKLDKADTAALARKTDVATVNAAIANLNNVVADLDAAFSLFQIMYSNDSAAFVAQDAALLALINNKLNIADTSDLARKANVVNMIQDLRNEVLGYADALDHAQRINFNYITDSLAGVTADLGTAVADRYTKAEIDAQNDAHALNAANADAALRDTLRAVANDRYTKVEIDAQNDAHALDAANADAALRDTLRAVANDRYT